MKIGCGGGLLGWFVITLLFSFWTDRNLEFLLDWLKPENTDSIPWFLSWLATLFVVGFPFNIVMEILRIFVSA